jgi:CBS domain-containing protein
MNERLATGTSGDPGTDRSQSLAELFHLVRSLMPKDQKLSMASPEMTVAEAVEEMRRCNYSQLPVAVGNVVLGVFSYRSLAARMLEMGLSGETAGGMPVDEFTEEWRFVHPSDGWESLLDLLDRKDGVLVGNRERVEGILTTMDALNYLYGIASPFVTLAEIELSLRRIIQACVDEDQWETCVQNCLTSKYRPDELPSELSEMTFSDYVQIIAHGLNWELFADVFGQGEAQRKRTHSRLTEVRDLRNEVFHFRRQLTDRDRRRLSAHASWLQMKVRAFEAKQHLPVVPVETAEGPTREDFRRLLTRIPVARGQKQVYKALYDAGERGMSQDELVEAIGRRDRHDLAGILGALGNRVNGTPGYGQRVKPAMGMVVTWEQMPDGQWRYWLRPRMREALEKLDPNWLHDMVP